MAATRAVKSSTMRLTQNIDKDMGFNMPKFPRGLWAVMVGLAFMAGAAVLFYVLGR